VSGAGLDALNLKIQHVPYRAAGLSRAILAVNIAHFPTLTNRKVAAPLLGLQCGAAFPYRQTSLSHEVLQYGWYRTVCLVWIAFAYRPSVNSRLEDRIRELCALAIVSNRDDQRALVLAELTAALREHAKQLKKIAVVKLVKKDEGFQDRRCTYPLR
jgi:hypothetical protein